MTDLCHCCSGQEYEQCCGVYHKGALPKTPLLLMRSRYSAYCLGLIDYIIETTHPDHHDFTQKREEWKKQLRAFSSHTHFEKLEILSCEEMGANTGYVTFTAHLRQAGQDRTFTERSLFEKVNDKWLYRSGTIF